MSDSCISYDINREKSLRPFRGGANGDGSGGVGRLSKSQPSPLERDRHLQERHFRDGVAENALDPCAWVPVQVVESPLIQWDRHV